MKDIDPMEFEKDECLCECRSENARTLTDMSEKEMGYDGGFPWAIAGFVASIACSAASSLCAKAGYKELAVGFTCASLAIGVVSGGTAVAGCINAVSKVAAIRFGGQAAWNLCGSPIYNGLDLAKRVR